MKAIKHRPIMWVDFEEFKPETYKGCLLTNIPKTFKSYTGDFETDYNACSKEAAKYDTHFICSSSVDDWFSDSDFER